MLSVKTTVLTLSSVLLRVATAKQKTVIQGREWYLSLPVEDYVGSYSNDLLGQMTVKLDKDNKPLVRWGKLAAVATGFDRKDHFRVEFSPNSGDLVAFVIKDGRVDAISFADAAFKRAD